MEPTPDSRDPGAEESPAEGSLESLADMTLPHILTSRESFSVATPKIGSWIGEYRIEKYLGLGSYSHILLGHEPDTDERYVLKIGRMEGGGRMLPRLPEITTRRVPEGVSPDETPSEAFFIDPYRGWLIYDFNDRDVDAVINGECERLEKLNGTQLRPGLPGSFPDVQEKFYHQGRPVIRMEYLEGPTLRDHLRTLQSVQLRYVSTIAESLAGTIAVLGKELGYHGDLRPENIVITMVDGEKRVRLISPSVRVFENCFTTSPHYNPFLLRTEKADVMALGIMMYEILTGERPFREAWNHAGKRNESEDQRLERWSFLTYTPPKYLNSGTLEWLSQIVYRAIVQEDYLLKDLRADLSKHLNC